MPFLPVTADQITENASNQASTPKDAAIITTLSLTTAAGATHTMTFFSPAINPASLIGASVGNGSNTAGTPAVASVTPHPTIPGQATVVLQNIHASNALNGTLKVSAIVFN